MQMQYGKSHAACIATALAVTLQSAKTSVQILKGYQKHGTLDIVVVGNAQCTTTMHPQGNLT